MVRMEQRVFVNQEMIQILGYTAEEIAGRLFFDFVDSDSRSAAEQYLKRIKNGIAEKHEISLRHKNGSRVWTLISANSLTDDSGRLLGTLCMISDITERRRLEKEVLENQPLGTTSDWPGLT